MDWEGLREKTLGEVANTLVSEGVGVGAGFIGASTIGRRVEDYMLTPAQTAELDVSNPAPASWSTIIKGWAYNNAPKLAIWYVIRKYVPEVPETRTQEMMMDAKKAIAGSLVFDTLLRTTNHGKPVHDPGTYKLLGGKGESVRTAAAPQADTQRLIQENSALRTELNKALQRLAAPAPQPVYAQAPAPQAVHVAAPQPVQMTSPQVTALQADVQRLIQENSAIRADLNNASQRIAAQAQRPVQPVQVQVQAPQVAQAPQPVQVRQVAQAAPIVNVAPIQRAPVAPVVRYQPAPAPAPVRTQAPPIVRVEQQQPIPPAIAERERRFAFMPTHNAPPEVQEREKKYGFAGKSSEKEIATMFGML
jgi:regulator of replication initiation timing